MHFIYKLFATFLVFLVFGFSSCVPANDPTTFHPNDKASFSSETIDLKFIFWVLLGANAIGGVLFIIFGSSTDPSVKLEHGKKGGELTNVRVTIIDAM